MTSDASVCSALPSLGGAPAQIIRILDFEARVVGPVRLLPNLRGIFPSGPAWSTSGEATFRSHFRISQNTPRPGTHRIDRDGTRLCESAGADLLPHLEWSVNSSAVEQLTGRYLLLHAGAVARGDRAMILPASSGSGKTTLTTALVAAGFQYLSDEVAVLDMVTGLAHPFAKSLSVKQGSRSVLARYYPDLAAAPSRPRFGESVTYLAPPENSWPSEPVPVRYVILPRYVPDAPTELSPIARSSALPTLLEQCFGAQTLGKDGIAALVRVLAGAACYSLTVSDLEEAIHLLTGLADW